MFKTTQIIQIIVILFLFSFYSFAENNCLKCHKGIEDIRDPKSEMMKQINKVAKEAGFPENSCIVCHGGNPKAKTKEEAHKGTIEAFLKGIETNHGIVKGPQNFYPDPGSPWINKYTCGMCHQEQVKTQRTSFD